MLRIRLLAAALALCLVGTWAAPVYSTTRAAGTTIEVEECYYSYLLGGSWWSIECRYRIDGGEWLRAYQEGTSGSPQMRLPATSVQAQVVDRRVVFSAEEDVASLHVGSRRVK
jgi:hypothetical protein